MKIYTTTGDRGETRLLNGSRVWKNHIRIEALGEVDELNTILGVVRAFNKDREIDNILRRIQNELFTVGEEVICRKGSRRGRHKRSDLELTSKHVEALESLIDRYQSKIRPLKRFILPAGTQVAALLHFARTVARRVERRVVTVSRKDEVNPELLRYLNRLSDLLFILARFVNREDGVKEEKWILQK